MPASSKVALALVSAVAAYYTVTKPSSAKEEDDSPLNMEVPATKNEEPEKTPETDSASGKTEDSVMSEATKSTTTPVVSQIPADLKKRDSKTSMKSAASVSGSKRSFRASMNNFVRKLKI